MQDFGHLNPTLEKAVTQSLVQKPRDAKSWPSLLGTEISQSCENLLGKLLAWSPAARPLARDLVVGTHAVGDPFFDRIRTLSEEDCAKIGTRLFDFTEEELRGPPGSCRLQSELAAATRAETHVGAQS